MMKCIDGQKGCLMRQIDRVVQKIGKKRYKVILRVFSCDCGATHTLDCNKHKWSTRRPDPASCICDDFEGCYY